MDELYLGNRVAAFELPIQRPQCTDMVYLRLRTHNLFTLENCNLLINACILSHDPGNMMEMTMDTAKARR